MASFQCLVLALTLLLASELKALEEEEVSKSTVAGKQFPEGSYTGEVDSEGRRHGRGVLR